GTVARRRRGGRLPPDVLGIAGGARFGSGQRCWRVRAPVENLGKPQTGPVVLPVFIRLTVVGGVGTRDDWLSMQEASERLHVHADTLRQWADRGRIRTFRTPGGHRRFQAADVDALAAHSSPELQREVGWFLNEVLIAMVDAYGRVKA